MIGGTVLSFWAERRVMDAALNSQTRKAKRVEVALVTTILLPAGERQEVELRDLSFFGFKAKCAAAPKSGDYVKVDLPNLGAVRARVSWARNGFFGGAFATAVDVRKCLAPPPAL
jgi:hypothetical protein